MRLILSACLSFADVPDFALPELLSPRSFVRLVDLYDLPFADFDAMTDELEEFELDDRFKGGLFK